MDKLLDFNMIDLSPLEGFAPILQMHDGCGNTKGLCDSGCGCGKRNGQCGGWTKPTLGTEQVKV